MESGEMPHLQFCLKLTHQGVARMVGGTAPGEASTAAARSGLLEAAWGITPENFCCIGVALAGMMHVFSVCSGSPGSVPLAPHGLNLKCFLHSCLYAGRKIVCCSFDPRYSLDAGLSARAS